MLGALFALIVQQSIIIYINLNRDELPSTQVVMSTYVVTDNRVQIFGEGAIVTVEECERFRERIHNPPTQDGDSDWALTVCEILDPEEIEIDNTDTPEESPSGEVSVPGPTESNQQ